MLWDTIWPAPPKEDDDLLSIIYTTLEGWWDKIFCNVCILAYIISLSLCILGIIYSKIYQNRQKTLSHLRKEQRRANQRAPQKRRPGAVYRDREIYRSVMEKVREAEVSDVSNTKDECIFRQTRSGTIYGQYSNLKPDHLTHVNSYT